MGAVTAASHPVEEKSLILGSTSLGKGGIGDVWPVTYRGEAAVYKRYKPNLDPGNVPDQERLQAMVDFGSEHPELLSLAAFPIRVVASGDTTHGFLMRPLPADHRSFGTLMQPYEVSSSRRPFFYPPQRLGFLGTTVLRLLQLHKAGVVVNDLHELNLCMWADTGDVMFLDCDSMGGPWGDATSVAPSHFPARFRRGQASQSTDMSRMALLCFHTLLGDPQANGAAPEWMGDYLDSYTIDFLDAVAAGELAYEQVVPRWATRASRWSKMAQPMAVTTNDAALRKWGSAERQRAELQDKKMHQWPHRAPPARVPSTGAVGQGGSATAPTAPTAAAAATAQVAPTPERSGHAVLVLMAMALMIAIGVLVKFVVL